MQDQLRYPNTNDTTTVSDRHDALRMIFSLALSSSFEKRSGLNAVVNVIAISATRTKA